MISNFECSISNFKIGQQYLQLLVKQQKKIKEKIKLNKFEIEHSKYEI
jgi:hypothetical protein